MQEQGPADIGKDVAAMGSALVEALPRPRPLADTLLRLIWTEKRISRAEIARRSALSRSTVSEVVGLLLPTGLVAEVGVGPSRGGRPPIVLEFQDQACTILGVEMGAAHVAVALTDLRGNVLSWQEKPFPVRSDPPGTRKLIQDLGYTCLTAAPPDAGPLMGIGIAVPSPVDPQHPDRLSRVVLPDWNGRSGLQEVQDYFQVPLLVDNDANLGALAERWWGAGRGVDNFAYVKIATGVGSGHVIGGAIYRGASGVAGEIGHMAIDPSGGPCICGLRGCLTTLVGTPAILQRTRALLVEYPTTSLSPGGISIDAITRAARDRDPLALRVIGETADHLGTAIAGMLNLMNPAKVILGGELATMGELLLDPLRESLGTRTLLSSILSTEVVTSALGPRSVAVGAATLVLRTALMDTRLFPVTGLGLEAR